ncbi:MAG TPA: GNAT family N-acetyltransferase [Anaerolineae bacterium]|nr:GNAT family N-acetyltransferase [Anaerolineae bacterium]
MNIDIVSFQDKHIDEAGALLAERHRRDRLSVPELPSRFDYPAVAAAAVAATWQQAGVSGVAAQHASHLAGYMLGRRVIDETWGRSAWVRPSGCALAPDEDAELARELYAALAAPWVDQGIFNHFAVLPVADPASLQAWFSLSFGIEQVYALADLAQIPLPPAPSTPGLMIRRAGPEDRQMLADFSDIIWRHQVQAPMWGVMLPEVVTEQRTGWAELADDANVTVWLAFLDGEPVGCQGYWPAEPGGDDLLTPDGCCELSVAGTRPHARGRGVGTALTHHGLRHAREAGYRFCLTDWRSTNLLAARFWPRQGFRPMAYRLARRIDQRIAWANPSAPRHESVDYPPPLQ